MGKKKATVGERIMMRRFPRVYAVDDLTLSDRRIAKQIDRAIRKAAKDAATAERERVESVLSGEYQLASRQLLGHSNGLREAVKIVRRMK